MRLKPYLAGILLLACASVSWAVRKDNYGTDECTQLVIRDRKSVV